MTDAEQLGRLLRSSKQKDGCEEWNLWYAEHPHTPIDLGRAVLADVDLSGANLIGVHLSNAVFRQVILTDVDLSGADRRARSRFLSHQTDGS